MDCLQLRSPPGPFHYLISEQAKSLVALQELQNEVGALLEFRDLVIETFPNLRSKMSPSTGSGGEGRREWEPGVRVRRKLAGGGDRAKPQPSVQDSGFSTETSCGKDAHSSSASASATRTRPLEDELWALLDVIQRKGQRLRDEAEAVRGELERAGADSEASGAADSSEPAGAEESFARVLASGACARCADLRDERDALLAALAARDADKLHARASSPLVCASRTPLGRLDRALGTPPRPPRVSTPDSGKFAAILHESNPIELQRQLLTYTVHNQVLIERLKRAAIQRTSILESLERAREINDDLRFRLDEKTIELESAKTTLGQLEEKQKTPGHDSFERNPSRSHSSMRDMEPVPIPDDDSEARISETPRRRPSKIPLHTANKGLAPRPPRSPAPHSHPPRPPSAHSVRSTTSARSRVSRDASVPPPTRKDTKPIAPLRRSSTPHHENKKNRQMHVEIQSSESGAYQDSLKSVGSRELVAEYVARTERLAVFSRLHLVRPMPEELCNDYRLAYESPQNLALELTKSILYEDADSIDIGNLKSIKSHGEDSLWNGKPQQYFESINSQMEAENVLEDNDYDTDSLAP